MKLPLNIISSLDKNGVRFLVVGGVAVVLYGVPRATFNLDIMIPGDEKNFARLQETLKKLGYSEVHDRDKSESGKKSLVCSIGELTLKTLASKESLRFKNSFDIDVVLAPDNQFFDFIYDHRINILFEGIKIPIPSLVDLIRIKEWRGTEKDSEDANKLRFQLMVLKRQKKT
jgi:hypothetical protein